MAAKVHPELLDQIGRAKGGQVQAVVQLRHADRPDSIPTPEESTKLAETVLKRVQGEVGQAATKTNVLRNIATMVVEAAPEFLHSLLRQPEVISARANQTSDNLFIPPVGKRPA